jgi:hypothetical protein
LWSAEYVQEANVIRVADGLAAWLADYQLGDAIAMKSPVTTAAPNRSVAPRSGAGVLRAVSSTPEDVTPDPEPNSTFTSPLPRPAPGTPTTRSANPSPFRSLGLHWAAAGDAAKETARPTEMSALRLSQLTLCIGRPH